MKAYYFGNTLGYVLISDCPHFLLVYMDHLWTDDKPQEYQVRSLEVTFL